MLAGLIPRLTVFSEKREVKREKSLSEKVNLKEGYEYYPPCKGGIKGGLVFVLL